MGRLSREAGGLGEYGAESANTPTDQPEPEADEPEDDWPVVDMPPRDDEDEPA